MKRCEACKQKLPLGAGDLVEGTHTATGELFQGMVVKATANKYFVSVITFTGQYLSQPAHLLTRLHGLFRIEERETIE
jgi:hypothetical protein